MKALLIGSAAGLAVFMAACLIIGSRLFDNIDFGFIGIEE